MDRIGFSRQFSFESVRKDTSLLDEGIITQGICTCRTFIPLVVDTQKQGKTHCLGQCYVMLPILAASGGASGGRGGEGGGRAPYHHDSHGAPYKFEKEEGGKDGREEEEEETAP
jgi:hypothetical protein